MKMYKTSITNNYLVNLNKITASIHKSEVSLLPCYSATVNAPLGADLLGYRYSSYP